MRSSELLCLCDRVVSRSPAKDLPGDGKGDVGVLQVPEIASQLSVSSVLSVGEIVLGPRHRTLNVSPVIPECATTWLVSSLTTLGW